MEEGIIILILQVRIFRCRLSSLCGKEQSQDANVSLPNSDFCPFLFLSGILSFCYSDENQDKTEHQESLFSLPMVGR